MSKESISARVTLSGIHLNLDERSITFEADRQPVARVTLAPEGVIFEAIPPTDGPTLPAETMAEIPTSATPEPTPRREPEPRSVLPGKLKTKPRAGKPDRRGNPTAWARFAAHIEGEDEAHLFSATFHRHTAKIALTLERNDPLTIEGYAHPSTDPAGTRLDSFSVINLVAYPGKGERAEAPQGS